MSYKAVAVKFLSYDEYGHSNNKTYDEYGHSNNKTYDYLTSD